jgi:twinkle protein
MLTYQDIGIELPQGARGNVKTRCPKCSHTRKDRRDKCLSVDVDRDLINCHNCGWGSSLAREARERGRGVFERPVFSGNGPAKPPQRPRTPPAGLAERAAQWFQGRGLSAEIVTAAGITAREQNGTLQIYFPYHVDGELTNVKRRIFPAGPDGTPDMQAKQFAQERDALHSLYGIDLVPSDSDEVWICEGELDALAIRELRLGHPVVSVPDGAVQPGQRAEGKLKAFDEPKAQQLMERVRRVYLALDGDEAGQALAAALVQRFGASRCFQVGWPDGCKDANEVLIRFGPEALDRALEAARPVPLPNVSYLHGLKARMYDIRQHGLPKGLSTGIATLDDYYRVLPGFVSVFSGIASHGKSQLLDNVIVNMAYHDDWKFAIFSPEKQPVEMHAMTMLSIINNAGYWSPAIGPEQIEVGVDWLADHFMRIETDAPTVEAVLQTTGSLVARHGVKGLVIDPWSTLESVRERQYSETEYIADAMRRFKDFAVRYGVHIWIVVHPTKLNYKGDEQPQPNEYDVSGSARWMDLSDHLLIVWRNVLDTSEPVQVAIRKCRYRHLGKPGKVYLDFDLNSGRYRSSEQPRSHAEPFDLAAAFAARKEATS